MRTVIGKILDIDGVEDGYVTLDPTGTVLERGKVGTLGIGKGAQDTVKGIVLPRSVNGHTHLGDSLWLKEPPLSPLSEIVAPPGGLKHRLMASAPTGEKLAAMRSSLQHLALSGTALTIDFREEGVEGVHLLRQAAEGTGVETFVLGRPTDWNDTAQVSQVLEAAEGLGVSSLKDVAPDQASRAAAEARRKGRFFALHVSEDAPEPIDPVLELQPSMLIHLTQASPRDLERVADARVPVVFCPRSNALFGGFPPMAQAQRLGIPFLLGTDNVMFNSPDLFREMEFAYLTSRARRDPLSPEAIVRAAFLTPWSVLHRPEMARLVPGSGSKTLALRLPSEDPYYQVCARASTTHVIHPK